MERKELLEELLSIQNLRTESIIFYDDEKFPATIDNRFVVTDGKKGYGVVGSRYTPISHSEAVSRIMEWLPDAELKTAVASYNRAKAVFSIELPKTYEVNGDEIKTYVNLVSSLDGSSPLGLWVSPLRTTCMNMFRLLKRKAFIKLNYRHTQHGLGKFVNELHILGKITELLEHQIDIANTLVGRKFSHVQMLATIEELHRKHIITEQVKDGAIVQLWHPLDEASEKENLWALFNHITYPINRLMERKHKIIYHEQLDKVGRAFVEMA